MATARPALFLPVEYYLASGTDFSVTGQGSCTDFAQGTYANVLSLMHSFCGRLEDDFSGHGSQIYDFRLTDTLNADGTYTTLFGLRSTYAERVIDFEDGGLNLLLGFSDDPLTLPIDTWVDADYQPYGMWIPTFQASDQRVWKRKMRDVAAGSVSQNGVYAGTTRGTDVFHHTVDLPFEFSHKLFDSKAQTIDSQDSTTWSLETFMKRALTAFPQSDTAASPQGFWYYPDINDAITDCTMNLTEPWNEATNIGINWDLDTPDTKVFCHTSEREATFSDDAPALPGSELRYNISFSCHTAPAESWQWYNYTGGGS